MKSKKNLTAMHVGEKRKLYVIPNQYLSSIMFQALVYQLKEEEKIEVGNKEPITLPYSTWLFESILKLEFGFRVYTLSGKLMLKHKSVQCMEKKSSMRKSRILLIIEEYSYCLFLVFVKDSQLT